MNTTDTRTALDAAAPAPATLQELDVAAQRLIGDGHPVDAVNAAVEARIVLLIIATAPMLPAAPATAEELAQAFRVACTYAKAAAFDSEDAANAWGIAEQCLVELERLDPERAGILEDDLFADA